MGSNSISYNLVIILLITDVTSSSAIPTSAVPTPMENYQHKAQLDKNYFLYWKINETHITFEVNVKTKGYVGFGISTTGKMYPSDVIIGWIKDGVAHFTDRYASQMTEPDIDSSQDWFLLHGEENDFGTVLKFYRKLNTRDKEDMKITNDKTNVIYAYHEDDPPHETGLPWHGISQRGFQSLQLLPPKITTNKSQHQADLPESEKPECDSDYSKPTKTQLNPTTTKTVQLPPTMSSQLTPPENFPFYAQLDDNGSYFLFWRPNATHVTFEVHVRARGYVGFGITEYGKIFPADIVIGWVKDGKTHFTDRHSTQFREPDIDPSQDWILIEGKENDFGTILKFTREIETSDINDIKITKGTMRIIYAYYTEDPLKETGLPWHGFNRRGSKSLELLSSHIQLNHI